MAEWLNTAFAALDGAVFSGMNTINCGFLNFFCKFISFFGTKAWFFFALGFVFLFFRKTRKLGVAVLVSVLIGALFTNLILKNVVARTRPYAADATFRTYWEAAGSNVESEFSFPSGHTTAVTATAVAIFLSCDKRWSWTGFIGVLLMAFSRVYLIVHYTTDVIAAMIVGSIGGLAGYYITKFLYKIINNHYDNKFCSFVLGADVINVFKKKDKYKDE